MSWQDRIREAAYTAPDGTRLRFDYEDVSRNTNKKTSAYEFPDADGTYVQDLGRSGRQYPLRVFLWGADYDERATTFEDLLAQRGIGTLEHPIYGVANVVPFGAITRRDDLKTAANQAVIEVTFWESIEVAYPSSQADPASAVLSAVGAFSQAAGEELDDTIGLQTAIERITFKNTFNVLTDVATSTLAPLAAASADVERQFDTIAAAIDGTAAPIDLAAQATQLIQAPARAAAAIADRLSTYAGLLTALTGEPDAVLSPGNDSREANTFHTRDLFASSYVSASVLSTVNTQFDTKTDALLAAEAVLDQFDSLTNWRDLNYASLGEVDTGTSYRELQEAVALTAGFLVFISFSLRQERRIVLDRARTIVDLCAELYGSVDDQLDFFIQSNSLTGSEILELPAGRECVYYV